jgi:hypothetical protein
MSIILEAIRPHRQPSASAIAPAIREVCLVGVASRHYRHVALSEGLGTQDSGLGQDRRSENGPPKTGTG